MKSVLIIITIFLLMLMFSKISNLNNYAKNDTDEYEIQDSLIISLGKDLFFDPKLSSIGTISCSSCHKPELFFSDTAKFSIGQNGKLMERNTPTIIGRPVYSLQFWDGRAISLFNQVVHPLENTNEMGESILDACYRINSLENYRKKFESAFGSENITPKLLTIALVAFMNSLKFSKTDFQVKSEKQKVSTNTLLGKDLFFGKAKCSQCHLGDNFSDERFHNTGISWKSKQNDLGRGKFSGRTEDIRAFKTPTLRDVSHTAPYMHNGSINSLEDVIKHYISIRHINDPNIDLELSTITLTI